MSYPPQPPSPYSPPGAAGGMPGGMFDYYQQADALAPAKRAGNMMFVLGTLLLLSTFCCGATALMLPRVFQDRPESLQRMQERFPQANEQLLQTGMYVMTGGVFFAAIVVFVLAVFVRGGSKGAIITSLVLAMLVELFLGLQIAIGVFQATQMHSQDAAVGSCIFVLIFALLALQIIFLFQAMRASDQVRAQQYAMQYWQYAQQQAYGQQQQQPGGYVYPQQYQPPPPPPPPTDQPPPPPPA